MSARTRFRRRDQCPEVAVSRRSGDEINPWTPNGDLRPRAAVHGRFRECRLSHRKPVVQLLLPEGHACVTIDHNGAREMLVGFLPPPFAPTEPPEADVAVGDKRAHVERLG
ncbi:MAG: hypothetical protein V3T03_03960 [Candidatus Bipolaricaulota bacterium]